MIDNVEMAEELLNKGDITTALEILKKIAYENPKDGRIAFNLGKVALQVNEFETGYMYLIRATELEYETVDALLLLANTEIALNRIKDAELHLNRAVEKAESTEEKSTCIKMMADFYISHSMYLRAEKLSKSAINELKESYLGYHIHYMIGLSKKNYEDSLAYLENIPDDCKKSVQFLIDYLDIFEIVNGEDAVMELIKNDERFMTIIPQESLRKEVQFLHDNNNYEEMEQVINKLAREFYDKDAILGLMVIFFSKGDLEKTLKISQLVLNNEVEIRDHRFYIALYFQIFCLYYKYKDNLTYEIVSWIKDASEVYIDFIKEIDNQQLIEDTLDSFQLLYDSINTYIKEAQE